MKVDKNSLLLYVVTDRSWLGGNLLEDQVEEIVQAGASFIQLREKELSFNEFVRVGKKIKEITGENKIPFVINDNIEVALALDADGVHVGQSDMNARIVRALIGEDKILGVSVRTVEQACLHRAWRRLSRRWRSIFHLTKNDAKMLPSKHLEPFVTQLVFRSWQSVG